MVLNPSKCKAMSVTRSRSPLLYPYKIVSTPIESVSTYKYLGVTISKDLNWFPHVSNIISSSNKTLGFLRRHLRSSPPHVKLIAYKSLIRPKLEYASAIWNPHQSYLIDALEMVQNRAIRFIHSSYSYNVSVSSLKAETGLPALSCRRRTASLSLFHKMYHSSLNQPPYISPPACISLRTGHCLSVARPQTRTLTFSSSFFPTHHCRLERPSLRHRCHHQPRCFH